MIYIRSSEYMAKKKKKKENKKKVESAAVKWYEYSDQMIYELHEIIRFWKILWNDL